MVDFHIHTLFSDGTYTPEEIAESAFKNGIKVFAITDHDSVDGIERGRAAALKEGLEFVSGIEFSTDFLGKEIHILGYFLNEKAPKKGFCLFIDFAWLSLFNIRKSGSHRKKFYIISPHFLL